MRFEYFIIVHVYGIKQLWVYERWHSLSFVPLSVAVPAMLLFRSYSLVIPG